MTSATSATRSWLSTKAEPFVPDFPFPKSARILRRADFRRVYEQGLRFSGPVFSAFCLQNDNPKRPPGARFGFTVPRAIGKAVVRNGIRRRLREAVRLEGGGAGPRWDIVINPRRNAADAPFSLLREEVGRLVRRCGT